MNKIENVGELLRFVPMFSLGIGLFTGVLAADNVIERSKQVFHDDDYSDLHFGFDETVTEGLMSLAAFLLPQALILLTSPIVVPLVRDGDVVSLSLAGLITGFELGIGLRGLKGMTMVGIEVVKNWTQKK